MATARLAAAIAASKAATSTTAQKRSQAATEEELFGSDSDDDDDDDAPQTMTSKETATAQTTMSDAGPSGVSAPAPKRMKKAMKPARL